MSAFQTFECEHCESEYKALEDAEAGEAGYCSPSCHTAAEL